MVPHNKGIQKETMEQSDVETTQYIRPTQSEVEMAAREVFKPEKKPTEGGSDRSCESVMVLRTKSDQPSEVEKKNFGLKDER